MVYEARKQSMAWMETDYSERYALSMGPGYEFQEFYHIVQSQAKPSQILN